MRINLRINHSVLPKRQDAFFEHDQQADEKRKPSHAHHSADGSSQLGKGRRRENAAGRQQQSDGL